MTRLIPLALVGTTMAAAGFWAGTHRVAVDAAISKAVALVPESYRPAALVTASARSTAGPVIYYRDPDGKPIWSMTPRKSGNKAFLPVMASEDVNLDPAAKPPETADGGSHSKSPRQIKYYRNPMGLPDTSPVPKKDNMGMDYIPVYEGGDADDANTISISPGRLQSTGVRSEPAALRRIAQTVRVPGTVKLDERRVAVVATRSDAYVDKVADVTTGDYVKKGEPLLTLYSPEINSAAAQLMANPGFEGSRRRLENLNVPAAVIKEIERTHTVPPSIIWTAPRNGVVLERGAVDGMKAAAGAVLFRIGDISTMWVLADVPEHDIGFVRLGQPVTVRVRSQPNRAYSGHVDLIYPEVNRTTRSTRVRIQLPNADGSLLADMYADVAIATGTLTPVVAVPDDAVIDTGTKQTVIIDRGGGRLEPRPVTLGVHGDGFTEIRTGVKPGERVVTSANFLIDAESNLRAALAGLSAANTTAAEKHP